MAIKSKKIRTQAEFDRYIDEVLRQIERYGNNTARDIEKEFKQIQKEVASGKIKFNQKSLQTASRKVVRIVNRDTTLAEVKRLNELMETDPNFSGKEIYAEIEQLWQDYKSRHNTAIKKLDKASQKGAFLKDDRRGEFVAYVLSGQFHKFNPSDVLPAYAGGDIFVTDENGNQTHVQLKGSGGYFKMSFSPEFLKHNEARLLLDYYNTSIKYAQGDTQAFSKELVPIMVQTMNDQAALAKAIAENPSLKNDVSTKVKVMEAYLSVTKGAVKWYMFSIKDTAGVDPSSPDRMEFSFSVAAKDMARFVETHADLFTINMENIKSATKPTTIKLTFKPKFVGNRDERYWKLGLGTDPVFLHNGLAPTFYAVRNAFDPDRQNFTKPYNDNVVKIGGKTSDEFLEVHEAVFGPLHLK